MSDSPTKVEPIICGRCFNEIERMPDNPWQMCPKCGTQNRLPKPAPRRKLSTAEKAVLAFAGVAVAVVVCAVLGKSELVRGLLSLIMLAGGLLFYFVPTIAGRKKRNAQAIMLLNLLLGWTLVGWVVALVWAVAKEKEGDPTPETHVQCPDCAELVRKEARVCKHCGARLKPQDCRDE
jgi:hypothetical protein